MPHDLLFVILSTRVHALSDQEPACIQLAQFSILCSGSTNHHRTLPEDSTVSPSPSPSPSPTALPLVPPSPPPSTSLSRPQTSPFPYLSDYWTSSSPSPAAHFLYS